MTASEVAQGFTSAAADDDRWVDPRLARLAATAAARRAAARHAAGEARGEKSAT